MSDTSNPQWVHFATAHIPEDCTNHEENYQKFGDCNQAARSYSGYKAHIYARTPEQVSHVMSVVGPLAHKHGWGGKYANDDLLDYLEEYSRNVNPHQQGKGVTVYFPDIRDNKHLDHINTLVDALHEANYRPGGQNGTMIHGDTMVSDSVGVRYEFSHGLMDDFGNPRNANDREYNELYVHNPYAEVGAAYKPDNNLLRDLQDRRVADYIRKHGMAFSPPHPEYRAPGGSDKTWDELPEKVYHVAPQKVRGLIEAEGLNPRGRTWNFATQKATWANNQYTDPESQEAGFHYRPEGVYVAPKNAASSIHKHLSSKLDMPCDIWEINTNSLRDEKDHPTDVIRDPEVFQSSEDIMKDNKLSPEEFWHNTSDEYWDHEDDNRSWVFEHVPREHIRRVNPYEVKKQHEWTDEDYEDYMDDHPEEFEDAG
jgi:hypothetical protein